MIARYYEQGYWPRESSADLFDRHAEKYPYRMAIKDSAGGQVTWRQLKKHSDRIACALLKMGFRHDDVLIVQLPNIVENCILRVALQKAGIIAVFPAMTLRDREIEDAIARTKARGIVVQENNPSYDFLLMARNLKKKIDFEFIFVIDEGTAETISIKSLMENEAGVDDLLSLKQVFIQPHEVAIIQSTSGTTGLPKLCEWPDGAISLHGRTIVERMNITREDIIGIMAPIAGGPGISVWNAGFYAASQMVLQDRSSPEENLKLIEKEKITVVGLVAAQIIRMFRLPDFEKYDLRSLRAIRPGGSSMSPTLAKEIEEKLPWCKVVAASGMSECMAITHTHIDDSFDERLLTAGKPWLHSEIGIANEKGEEVPIGGEGEVLVRGACTGGGYYKDPEMTKEVWGSLGEEGWCRTGDIGKIDEHGSLRLLGRKKEIIVRGGQNIYPKMVEEMLLKHPKIADTAVVSIPDPVMGEKVCAFVVTRANKTLNLQELVQFLDTQKVARFNYPERVVFLDKFPMLGTGKVDRKTLRGWAAKDV